MNLTKISQLSNLISRDLKRKVTIMLDPSENYRMVGNSNEVLLSTDPVEWEIPLKYVKKIDELCSNPELSTEEKIVRIYEDLCEDYTYDDNVLSYITKNDDDTFSLTDYYGRNTSKEWRKERNKHNKRNCFEMSRILAKSVKKITNNDEKPYDYNVCVIWDEAVTHYLVGLTGSDYFATLDLDDFNQIKDLTRQKANLTLEGIKIYEDPNNRLTNVVNEHNCGRKSSALDAIECRIDQKENIEPNYKSSIEYNDLEFIKETIDILKNELKIDSQGIYEYIKEIVDTKFGPRTRKKVWTEVPSKPGVGKIYTRGLVLQIYGKSYLIDVTSKTSDDMMRQVTKEDLNSPNGPIPYNKLQRNWATDPFDGRAGKEYYDEEER